MRTWSGTDRAEFEKTARIAVGLWFWESPGSSARDDCRRSCASMTQVRRSRTDLSTNSVFATWRLRRTRATPVPQTIHLRGLDLASTGAVLANLAEGKIAPLNSQSAASTSRVCAIVDADHNGFADARMLGSGVLDVRPQRSTRCPARKPSSTQTSKAGMARRLAKFFHLALLRSAPPDAGRPRCRQPQKWRSGP